MKRATSYLLGAVSLVALAALAACSESPTATPAVKGPTANVVSDGHMAVQAVYRHVMPTLPLAAAMGQSKSSHGPPGGGGGKKSTSNGIDYHGGPLLVSATNVAAVYWASSTIYNGGPTPGTTGSGSADGSLVGFFLNHLGGSPYFNINTTYYQGSSSNPVQNVVNYTQYWANNTSAPSGSQQVSDTQMINMLLDGFANGSLTYDPNTLYAIFTAGKVNLGGGFGTQYCAYHGYATATDPNNPNNQITILYAAMPYDYAYPTGCTMQTSPNGDYAADAEVNTLAHETEETTTDENLNAWYDHRGYENADKCAWTFGTTYTSGGGIANMNLAGKDFLVQQNWVNASGGYCAMSY